MKNIHTLPTDKPSRLIQAEDDELMLLNELYENTHNINKHIYITSDEEINKDTKICWCIDISCNKLVLCQGVLPSYHYKHYKKIIMTTDKSINVLCGCGKNCGAKESGVQPIPDEFLEWFVKNSNCEEVEVEKTYVTNSGLGYREYAVLDSNFKVIEINANIPQTLYYLGKITALYPYEYDINYKIIIPKEEHKQGSIVEAVKEIISNQLQQVEELRQETLEEAARTYGWRIKVNTFSDPVKTNDLANSAIQDFTEGAKWQAERMYSEEEVLEIIDSLFHRYASSFRIDAKEYFLQFKKK